MNKENLKDWVVLKTENYNSVTETLDNALQYSLLCGIIGFPGAGKSTSFSHYLAKSKNVIYLCLDSTFSARDFYIHLLRKFGVLDYGYDLNVRFLAEKLSNVITSRKEKTLIIIDDAGRFSAKMMELFQQVFDQNSNTGLILSGTMKFYDDFMSWQKNSKLGIPELGSRIHDWVMLAELPKEEMKAVARKNGVLDEDLLNELVKSCSNYRELHSRILKLRIKQLKRNNEDGKKDID